MKNNCLILFLFLSTIVFAGDSLVLMINVKSSYFTTDHLNNIYYVSEQNEIIKYEWQTNQTYRYSNNSLSKPTYIDVSNPLKLMAFYHDYNSIVLLDNKLSELNLIQLNKTQDLNNYQVVVACKEAEGDDFWIFDELSRKLIKLDENGNKRLESEAFYDLFNHAIIPNQILYESQTLYITDTAGSILSFDLYGNFISQLNIEAGNSIQIEKNNIIYLKHNMLSLFDLSSNQKNTLPLPRNNIMQVNLQNDKLFIRTDDAILVYISSL